MNWISKVNVFSEKWKFVDSESVSDSKCQMIGGLPSEGSPMCSSGCLTSEGSPICSTTIWQITCYFDLHGIGRRPIFTHSNRNRVVNILYQALATLGRFFRKRLWPAFGRQSLVGSSRGYTSHGHTSHASPRACGARLGQIVKSV